jgi:hypothetical protein
MAFLRTVTKQGKSGKRTYYYVVESQRRGDTVRHKLLEYLGRDPDPKRLKAALRYWKVGVKARGAEVKSPKGKR